MEDVRYAVIEFVVALHIAAELRRVEHSPAEKIVAPVGAIKVIVLAFETRTARGLQLLRAHSRSDRSRSTVGAGSMRLGRTRLSDPHALHTRRVVRCRPLIVRRLARGQTHDRHDEEPHEYIRQ
jgi:hypothetical protein